MTTQTPSVPDVILSTGAAMPQIGFGTFQVPSEVTQRVTESALEMGYRHIDTAAAYENEAGVGAALRASGLGRDEVFVTTKLRNGDQGYRSGLDAFERSREALGVEQVDLYLLHWPLPTKEGLALESWRAMEQIVADGAARAIGVCNFLPHHLEDLLSRADVAPVVNQIECHPTLQQLDAIAASQRHDVVVQAHTPLGQGMDLGNEVVARIAEAKGVTTGQVILRWHVDAGRVVLPRSQNPDHQRSNIDLFSFDLTDEERSEIDGLEAGNRVSRDPDTFDGSQYPQR